MAVWLAPPPIQEPATVVMPRHTASGPSTPSMSGKIALMISSAIGPPIKMPTVPVRNMITAFLPSLAMAPRSMLRVRNTRHVGSR